jgi:site-specific DNA recombinase
MSKRAGQRATEQTTIRAALYVRISADRTGEAAGVERQEASSRKLAEAKGWRIVDTYRDNDLSATEEGVIRPDYERLLRDIAAGKIDAIVCWNTDRLQRTMPDLLRLIKVGQKIGLNIQAVQGSSFDLGTSDGRLAAQILTAVANAEVEHKKERQYAANRSRAELGVPSKVNRTFGYYQDGTINDHEAYYVREVARLYHHGSSIATISRWLSAQGVANTHGNTEWNRKVTRYLLTNRRYIGELYYLGELIAKDLPAIMDAVTFELVAQRLAHDKAMRKQHPNAKKYLGASIYFCGNCGKRMISATTGGRAERSHGYACPGCIGRAGLPVDEMVEAFMVDALRSEEIRTQYASDTHSAKAMALQAEAQALEIDKAGSFAMLKAHQIDGAEYAELVAPVKERLLAITRERAEVARESALAEILGADDPGLAWLDHPDIHVRSKVLDEVARVTLYPLGRGKRHTPDSVLIEPRNATASTTP